MTDFIALAFSAAAGVCFVSGLAVLIRRKERRHQ